MTKKEMFAAIINAVEGKPTETTAAEMVEFLNHEIELLNRKRSSKSSKLTAKQMENEAIKERIMEILSHTLEGLTATDIMNELKVVSIIASNQKVNALVKQLISAELVGRKEVNGKAYFFRPDVVEGNDEEGDEG